MITNSMQNFVQSVVAFRTAYLDNQHPCQVQKLQLAAILANFFLQQVEKGRQLEKNQLKNLITSMASEEQNIQVLQALSVAIIKESRNLYLFRCLPTHLKSKETCLAAVDSDGKALEYVPENLKDRAMCLTAVKRTGQALWVVPPTERDEEICLTALKTDGEALKDIPLDLINRKVYLTAVNSNGNALSLISDEEKDPEICLAAVQNCWKALQSVPEPLKSWEICLAAVEQDLNAFKWIPEHIQKQTRQGMEKWRLLAKVFYLNSNRRSYLSVSMPTIDQNRLQQTQKSAKTLS
jgi:hypothetical protein